MALTDFPHADMQRQAVQSLLDTTLQTALCVRGLGVQASVFIVVDNVAAGHEWPSGAAQDRRAWFEVNAYSAGVAIYQSGVAQAGASPADSDLWLIQDCLLNDQGERVDTFWDAATTDSNQLPGPLTFDANSPLFYRTHVTQSYPRSGQKTLSAYPDRVTLDVHLLAFPFELFDDLFSDPARVGLSAAEVQALRAKLVPLNVGKQLEWTAAVPRHSLARWCRCRLASRSNRRCRKRMPQQGSLPGRSVSDGEASELVARPCGDYFLSVVRLRKRPAGALARPLRRE